MSHTYGTMCPDCLAVTVKLAACPEGCPDPHGIVYSTWPEHGCPTPGENKANISALAYVAKPVFVPSAVHEGPYSFSEIEDAIVKVYNGEYASPDSWGVPVIYRDMLIDALREVLRTLT